MTTRGSSGVSARYAQALFELAEEAGEIDKVGRDLASLAGLVENSDELADFIASPLYGASVQISALDGLMKKLKVSDLTARFVRLVAKNRRLGSLPPIIKAYQGLVAHMRGEVTAEVTSAVKLTQVQNKKIAATLKKSLGQAVQIKNTVDPEIMGGLIVRIGSRMIDTSLKSRLNTLETTLKGI